MVPRSGGEADKLGNRYELAWAVRHALYCVRNDRCALIVEDNDVEVGRGSEFTYDTGTFVEVHQVKRQNGNSNGWTVRELADRKIFEAAVRHVAAGIITLSLSRRADRYKNYLNVLASRKI